MKLRDGLVRVSQNHVSRTTNNRTTISIAVTIRSGQIDIASYGAWSAMKIPRPDRRFYSDSRGAQPQLPLIYTKFDKNYKQHLPISGTAPKFALSAPAPAACHISMAQLGTAMPRP
jgi:hypothetical protein